MYLMEDVMQILNFDYAPCWSFDDVLLINKHLSTCVFYVPKIFPKFKIRLQFHPWTHFMSIVPIFNWGWQLRPARLWQGWKKNETTQVKDWHDENVAHVYRYETLMKPIWNKRSFWRFKSNPTSCVV